MAGLILPWNAPFLSAARALAPALAAGCLVIVKTDEWTPVSASVLPEIMAEAGMPDGVFSLLHGRHAEDAAPALLGHDRVPLISFAGDPAGVQQTVQAAAHLKRVSATSTGATPCVIFGDADLDRASGRSASVWTADLKRAETIAGVLRASVTWVNSLAAQAPMAPGIAFLTQSRTVHVAPDDVPVPAFGG
ncbi:MAG TPA: aldehyde dehydrogenase family protein [Trebonia sp.]